MNDNNLSVILDALAEQIRSLKETIYFKNIRIETLEKELAKEKEGKKNESI